MKRRKEHKSESAPLSTSTPTPPDEPKEEAARKQAARERALDIASKLVGHQAILRGWKQREAADLMLFNSAAGRAAEPSSNPPSRTMSPREKADRTIQ